MNQGTTHWNAKLSDLQVAAILAARQWTTKQIAEFFGIHPRYVRKLRARHSRKVIRL